MMSGPVPSSKFIAVKIELYLGTSKICVNLLIIEGIDIIILINKLNIEID